MGRAGDISIAKPVAFVVGVLYVIAALIGFIETGFTPVVGDTGDKFLGFFDLNVFHNVVHLGIGLILVLASLAPDPTVTEGVLIGGGLVYILAAILGFTNSLQDLLSIESRGSFDNFFHLASGLAALAFGLLGARQSRAAPPSETGGAQMAGYR